MKRSMLTILITVALAGCASAPEPPTVNGRHRVQVNSVEDQQAIARVAFPPPPVAPFNAPHVVPVAAWSPYYTMTGCHSGSGTFQPANDYDSKLRAMLSAGVDRVELRATSTGNAQRPERKTLRCMESAFAWLAGQGVPQSKIFVNYTPASASARRVDITFYRR